ncbi:peptidase inhibitor family I36 protein [Kitasatospora sp. NPDC048286]|uniref:peptidase inhibitor family I36 protein n=1 Tax=Kitasatospora sp. NPDC048286 TaxID=3364047 RepID=UPI00371CE792
MNLRRMTTRLAVGAATVAGVLAATTTSASADVLTTIQTGAGKCPANWVCLWSDNNFIVGNPKGGLDYGAIGANQNIPDIAYIQFLPNEHRWKGMVDDASSVVNNTGSSICFYEHNNYGGLEFKIGPHEQWASVPSWINDKISSFKFC